MDSFLSRLVAAGVRIPERLIWHIFGCLTRACLGIEYPADEQVVWNNIRATGGRYGPPFSETLEHPGSVPRPRQKTNVIHFDIRPANILVGDVNVGGDPDGVTPQDRRGYNDRHTLAPVFKIADFSSARRWQGGLASDPFLLQRTREFGVPAYYTPEQFTEEWDAVNFLPDWQHNYVAGRYSWKTNLYQIGLVMYNAITLRQCAGGSSRLRWDTYNLPDLSGVPHGPWPFTQRKSWSVDLVQLNNSLGVNAYSNDLIELVQLCLCDKPESRPDPRYVLEVIAWRLDNHPWPANEDHNAIQAFINAHVAAPPPPPVNHFAMLQNYLRAGGPAALQPALRV
ncbi:hypothetical protein B0T14DRAFT_588992 [Immersiella caudata]|uniref:Protein kinase domain-containing protein n=1 Tax=Immersiella caudata TaxID=314043 RepID=A0AA39WJY9_9PEZI|nr:hypothetical protein B0T14DRAFT_588992 [Immersiella caudata]